MVFLVEMSSGKKLVYVKKHVSNRDIVVAICDYELLGMRITDSDKKITIYVDPLFYQGELVTIEEAIEALKEATIANLIGKNIVEAVVRNGLVLRETVIEVAGVPHVQLINISAGE